MSNYFSAVKKINPRGVEDDVLEIFVDSPDAYRINNVLAESGTYTFVVWYCSAADCNITFNVLGTSETVPSTTVWTKYIKTVQYDGTNNNIDISQDLDSTIYLYEGYITKGDKDKSWSLAPEDWEYGKEERDDLITETMTFAQQTSDKFSWLVKDGTNETNFTLTSRTAELVSEHINLRGLVTFSGLNTDAQEKINSAIDVSNENNAIISSWISDAINEGVTQIHGGYIKAQTIDTDHLIVDSIFAEGTAVMNIINAQEINAERITSGLIKSKFLELYGMKVLQKDTELETLSITDNGEITLRGSVESYNYVSGQSGWSIRSNGDAEFNNVVVRGDLINTDGGIASDIIDNIKTVRFWAGASYEEREYAPFIVYSDGSVVATKGEFSGLWTGNIEIGNISIVDPSKTSGNDAILTIQNGQNGIKRVQLNDTELSTFAQDLIVTDDFYNTVIALKQDGTGIFSEGISIGNNTSINKDAITLDGYVLKTGSNGYVFASPQVDIGSSSNNSLLEVYGESHLNGLVRIEKTINFGDVVDCTVSSSGIDFNFIN